MNDMQKYALIDKNDQTVFFGQFVKYFLGQPYIAVFSEYPAQETTVMVLAATSQTESAICYRLVNRATNQVIGCYTPLRTVRTEAEAQKLVKQESAAMGDLLELIANFRSN